MKDLLGNQEYEQVISACNEIEALLRGVATTGGERQLADALSVKSVALARMGRAEEAVVVCDEILSRYGSDEAPHLAKTISGVLANKVALAGQAQSPARNRCSQRSLRGTLRPCRYGGYRKTAV